MLKSVVLATRASSIVDRIPELEYIEDLGGNLLGFHVWIADVLAESRINAFYLRPDDALDINQMQIGDLMTFSCGVRSRGVSRLEKCKKGVAEVYLKSAGFKFKMIISSRWITGDHSRVYIGSGSLSLCGMFTISGIDLEERIVNCIPILLADPIAEDVIDILPSHSHFMSSLL